MDVERTIRNLGVVPVIKIDDANNAVPLAKALRDGGLPVAEITFRTDAAEESISRISREFPDMLVGAGTVLTVEQAEKAKNAGAKFLVSPGLNQKVVKWSIENGLPIYPGCVTPTEIEAALDMGLTTLKFFPAAQSGGLAAIKAVCAPYTNVSFIPTGGIDLTNLAEYLAFPKVAACGGSFMVKDEFINAGEWEKITELTKSAVRTVLGFEIAHVGVNCGGAGEAQSVAGAFADVFGVPVKTGASSVFAGTMLEAMNSPYLGKNGHIAVKTNNILRAVHHMETRGVKFDRSTSKTNDKGDLIAIYLQGEIGGFAVHLLQK